MEAHVLIFNVRRLCEVAGNRSRKFRFRRHVAKANFYLLNYEKMPIKLAFADYEAENFQLRRNPAILQNPCYRQYFFRVQSFVLYLAVPKMFHHAIQQLTFLDIHLWLSSKFQHSECPNCWLVRQG